MRSNRRARALITALTLTGALGLAACGGDDSGDAAAPSATTSVGAESTASSMADEATGSSMADDMEDGAAAGAAAGTFGPACSQVPADGAGSFDGMAAAPAATAASANPLLSTLVGAVQSAGLVETLNGPGPFTVFAPYNDAFAKLDAAALNAAMADPKGALTNILTYHVVGEDLDPEALADAGSVKTVQGGEVAITGMGDELTIGGAKVLCGNVKTANGTVYIIDSVLMPS
jgi:uncharacterized surface protein with fasciclin (FAS1) repeats